MYKIFNNYELAFKVGQAFWYKLLLENVTRYSYYLFIDPKLGPRRWAWQYTSTQKPTLCYDQ